MYRLAAFGMILSLVVSIALALPDNVEALATITKRAALPVPTLGQVLTFFAPLSTDTEVYGVYVVNSNALHPDDTTLIIQDCASTSTTSGHTCYWSPDTLTLTVGPSTYRWIDESEILPGSSLIEEIECTDRLSCTDTASGLFRLLSGTECISTTTGSCRVTEYLSDYEVQPFSTQFNKITFTVSETINGPLTDGVAKPTSPTPDTDTNISRVYTVTDIISSTTASTTSRSRSSSTSTSTSTSAGPPTNAAHALRPGVLAGGLVGIAALLA